MFGWLPLKRVDDRVVFVSRDSRVAIVNDDFLTTDLVEDNSVDNSYFSTVQRRHQVRGLQRRHPLR